MGVVALKSVGSGAHSKAASDAKTGGFALSPQTMPRLFTSGIIWVVELAVKVAGLLSPSASATSAAYARRIRPQASSLRQWN
jgi:hypothetical protein